jgi:hypothetical protein
MVNEDRELVQLRARLSAVQAIAKEAIDVLARGPEITMGERERTVAGLRARLNATNCSSGVLGGTFGDPTGPAGRGCSREPAPSSDRAPSLTPSGTAASYGGSRSSRAANPLPHTGRVLSFGALGRGLAADLRVWARASALRLAAAGVLLGVFAAVIIAGALS